MATSDTNIQIKINVKALSRRAKHLWFVEGAQGSPDFPEMDLDAFFDYLIANNVIWEMHA